MYSAFKSDHGCSRVVLFIYGFMLIGACVMSSILGSFMFGFAGIIGVMDEGTLNVTDTQTLQTMENIHMVVNQTWVSCCTGELPDFDMWNQTRVVFDHDDERIPEDEDFEMEDREDDHHDNLRHYDDDEQNWDEMSDDEKHEKMDAICSAVTDALEKQGESLHCDEEFDVFYHMFLKLLMRGLIPLGLTMMMASGLEFITMVASCCLVCLPSSVTNINARHSAPLLNGASTVGYAHYQPPVSTAPTPARSSVVSGSPVF